MENLITQASEFGLLGLILLGSFWYINKLNNQANGEKADMIQILLDTNKTILEVVEKNTEAFIELKEIIKRK